MLASARLRVADLAAAAAPRRGVALSSSTVESMRRARAWGGADLLRAWGGADHLRAWGGSDLLRTEIPGNDGVADRTSASPFRGLGRELGDS